MTRITEYVGADGVRSSKYDHFRLSRPRAGDLIEWPNGKIGMVEYRGSDDTVFADKGQVHCCTHRGSAFLMWSEQRREATLSISGGPFITVEMSDLEPTLRLMNVDFWNWGDNHPGADMGCQYTLARPLFRYTGPSTHYSIFNKEN